MNLYRINKKLIIDLDKVMMITKIPSSRNYNIIFNYNVGVEINQKEYLELLGLVEVDRSKDADALNNCTESAPKAEKESFNKQLTPIELKARAWDVLVKEQIIYLSNSKDAVFIDKKTILRNWDRFYKIRQALEVEE